MVRQHRTTAAVVITLALTASLAPTASADPAPLARAEAAITADSRQRTRPTQSRRADRDSGQHPLRTVARRRAQAAPSATDHEPTAWTPDESGRAPA